jgi:hypothetical protein
MGKQALKWDYVQMSSFASTSKKLQITGTMKLIFVASARSCGRCHGHSNSCGLTWKLMNWCGCVDRRHKSACMGTKTIRRIKQQTTNKHQKKKKEKKRKKHPPYILTQVRVCLGLVVGETFGHNRLRSECLQVQPVTCSHPPVFLYKLGYILVHMPLKWLVTFLQFWISTGYFSYSTGFICN